jgi:hypothetical protein
MSIILVTDVTLRCEKKIGAAVTNESRIYSRGQKKVGQVLS